MGEIARGEAAAAAFKLVQYLHGHATLPEHLEDTGDRLLRALEEMTGVASLDGRTHTDDPALHLQRTFPSEGCDEMVVVAGIEFVSVCEHHLLPFTGTAAVGYIPNGAVVGLSKIPRMVTGFARRMQIQERLTNQVADAMWDQLTPVGVGATVTASHSCLACRGARQAQATMTTTALRGAMRELPEARAEFMSVVASGV